MIVKIEITPKRDTDNSFPAPVEFIIDTESNQVILGLDSKRALYFEKEEVLKILEFL